MEMRALLWPEQIEIFLTPTKQCVYLHNLNSYKKRLLMFAIIKTGGKQYRVAKDDKIEIESLDEKDGASIDFDEVLYVNDGKASKIGEPVVKGASVKAKVIAHVRGPKITVFKKKRRQNYRRKKGHRQGHTLIQITDIKS